MIHIPSEWLDKTNVEIAELLNVTPQAVLYAKRRALNLCERCGKTATDGRYCARHAKALRKYHRKRHGHRAWKPGGRGRPPLNRPKEPTTL